MTQTSASIDHSTVKRFWAKVVADPSGCLIWQAGQSSGYGRFRVGGLKDGAFTDPIRLPLMTAVPGGYLDRPFPPDPTVQLDTLGGKHFLLPLTVGAARRLIVALAAQLQAGGFPLESELDEPARGH